MVRGQWFFGLSVSVVSLGVCIWCWQFVAAGFLVGGLVVSLVSVVRVRCLGGPWPWFVGSLVSIVGGLVVSVVQCFMAGVSWSRCFVYGGFIAGGSWVGGCGGLCFRW